MNLYLNMETNVRSKTPRYVQCNFPNEMPQNDKNWQLMHHLKNTNSGKKTKLQTLWLKLFSICRCSCDVEKFYRTFPCCHEIEPSLLSTVADQSNKSLLSITGYKIGVKRDSIIRLLLGKGIVCVKCSLLILFPVFGSTGIFLMTSLIF